MQQLCKPDPQRGRGAIWIIALGILAAACGGSTADDFSAPLPYQKPAPAEIATLRGRLALETIQDAGGGRISRGTFAVPENRRIKGVHQIHLEVIVLHARSEHPRPDAYIPLAGGPGSDITDSVRDYIHHWAREERDIVLVSQRGTGGDNRLDCDVNGNDEDLQSYLGPLFSIEGFQACLRRLQEEFDLTCYSTFDSADDLNELRLALGYDRVNLRGASYGTRMALIYMRQYPETVRTAVLNGVAPIAFKNPLYHAPAAQEALRLLFARCAADPDCGSAFPDLEGEFLAVLDRLEKRPARVEVIHPSTGVHTMITLTRSGFAEALRTMMYIYRNQEDIPRLIHMAFQGDIAPFAQEGLERERALRRLLAFGHLLCVTCSEDVDRIREEEIKEVTAGTFQGDERVREQIEVCRIWPRSPMPDNFGEPVAVDIPTLLLSGDLDPVTPPRCGEEAASHLPRSLHLVVPGAHGLGGSCLRSIEKDFLAAASVEGLDVSCTSSIQPLRFKVGRGD